MRSRSQRPTAFGKAPPLVLVVDDDPAIRRFVERMLDQLGCTVIGAESGAEARAICAQRPLIRLAIVDLTLPDADGQALVGEMRRLLADAAPPFILFTGRAAPERLPAGVVAVLRKPIGMHDFTSAVKKAIGARGVAPKRDP